MAYLWRPKDFAAQCRFCGVWTRGPFKDRVNVPKEELDAWFSQVMGEPTEGWERPAPPPHEDRMLYETRARNYSGSSCDECNAARHGPEGSQTQRIKRLRRVMEKPDPTPEQALDFFTTPPEEEEPATPPAPKRRRRVLAKPQEQPQAPTGTDDDKGDAS